MPPQRRMRVFSLLAVIAIIATIYMTSAAHSTQNSDFYTKTQTELQAREYEKATKLRDADDVSSRLKAAEEVAKELANQKSQKYHDSVDGGDSGDKSVAGRVMLKEQGGDKKKVQGVAAVGGRPRDREPAMTEQETQEQHDVEVELNAILKKSPMIIFSKSYCPHSMDAKRVLLEVNKIVPAPYVVELDKHPMGAQLQLALGDTTGRKTVPNVLLMGKSIGGGDDIVALDRTGQLLNKVKSMGGSRIIEASRRESGTTGANPEMRKRRRA